MNEWGLMQAPSTGPSSPSEGAVIGGLAGGAIGAVIGYLMKPRLLSVAIPTALLGGMGAVIGYSGTKAGALTSPVAAKTTTAETVPNS
ncbi:MAG TPA: hypothetical protein VMI75_04490 [Polyangiaceae bacterium]|nr:hypothetical protein [Polyangiaceae bacterium]